MKDEGLELLQIKTNIGGSWENELKFGISWDFWAEEEFLSPAWTTKRS